MKIETLDYIAPESNRNENISQAIIAVVGIIALWCLTHKMLIGSLIGLVGQPFWLWSTYKKRQWGMLFLSAVYVFIYGEGTVRWLRSL